MIWYDFWYVNLIPSFIHTPGMVCLNVGSAHGPPSSGCPGVRWQSRATHRLFHCRSHDAAWYAVCQCVSQTCGTRRRGTDPSPDPKQLDWPAVPLLSFAFQSLGCRWSFQSHLRRIDIKLRNLPERSFEYFKFVLKFVCYQCGPCWGRCLMLACHWTESAICSCPPQTSSHRTRGCSPSQSHTQTTRRLQTHNHKCLELPSQYHFSV